MSKGGGTNVETYDPSVKDAEIQLKRQALTDDVTKRAFGAAKQANVYSETALNSLKEGLGLLSQYLDDEVAKERSNLVLSESAVDKASKLRQKAKAGGSFIMGAAEDYLKQAEKM